MLNLKTIPLQTKFTCPDCNCKLGQSEDLVFQGTHVLADCLCECCENRYYHTIPTGHSVLFPVSFSQKTLKYHCDKKAELWLAIPLIDSIRNSNQQEASIAKKVYKEYKEIILLNCLDSCYGHVWFRLLNAQRYIRENPSKGVVVLCPASFEWLLPKGLAEVWLVNAKLSVFANWIGNLDKFIKEELKRFDEVLLADAPIHPDISKIELFDFLKTEKFPLEKFELLPYTITFALREERFWTSNKVDAFLMKVAISRKWMSWMKGYFVNRQNNKINKLAKEIQNSFSSKIRFNAIGLGKTGQLDKNIQDFRTDKITVQTEELWCKMCSETHIVIGIHGSNMLIPSALSAGFINILPRYKIDNITEDIAMNHKGRYMQFLGRFVDEFSSTKLIAKHAVSMLNNFSFFWNNMKK
jgi:hypothetical protein